MADRKQKPHPAYRRRIERPVRELSRVERQIACLEHSTDQAARFELLVERQVVLFAEHRSHQMH